MYLGLPAYVPATSSLPTYEKNAYLDLSPNIPTPSSVLIYEFVSGLPNTLGTGRSASKRVHGSRANLEKVSVVVDLSQSLCCLNCSNVLFPVSVVCGKTSSTERALRYRTRIFPFLNADFVVLVSTRQRTKRITHCV